MAMVWPNVGEVEALKRLLYSDAGAEDLTLKLFKSNTTPAETDTAGTYTEADFTGYSAETLTSSQSGSTWEVPTTSGSTRSDYQTPLVWTCGATGNTIYGYFVIGATSGILYFSERFASSYTLADTDTFTLNLGLEAA